MVLVFFFFFWVWSKSFLNLHDMIAYFAKATFWVMFYFYVELACFYIYSKAWHSHLTYNFEDQANN